MEKDLEFISKDLSNLSINNNSSIEDEDLSNLFENILCDLFKLGKKHMYIGCTYEENKPNNTYLFCQIKGDSFPFIKKSMSTSAYERFCQIITSYGPFYTDKVMKNKYGLIVALGNSKKYHPHPYDFSINMLLGNKVFGYHINVIAIYDKDEKKWERGDNNASC